MPIHSDLFYLTSALLLGIVAGMRSMMAPAILALILSRRPELAPPVSPASWFAHPSAAIVLGLAALAELVGDKLPKCPNRTALGPFVARMVTGGVTGAAFLQIAHLNAWLGAALGVIGAIAGTFGGFHARRAVVRSTRIKEPYVGLLEDIIAIAIAASIVSQLVS
jgi:uncharacterized membrane protein